MKIKIAKKSGFCFGVKRALDIAFDATKNSDEIYSYGQIIHNNQVSEKLSSEGLIEIDDIGDIKGCDLIIRSHGVGKDIYQKSEENDIKIIDCTCPFVKKVHKIVDECHQNGYKIIIVGDSNHPEVIGINGWCENSAIIVNDEERIPKLDPNLRYCVVSQTTLKEPVWNFVTNTLKEGIKQIEIYNTICSATSERQLAATELAKEVDCMIVIGGYHSSNTKKLYEIANEYCKKTYHIEKKSDLVMTKLENCAIIGITAGASTPDWVINEICDFIDSYNH